MAITTAAAAVVSVGYSVYSGNKQQRAANEANQLQAQAAKERKLQADVQALRARRQAARDAVSVRSSINAQAANEGGVSTSATQGAMGSVATQAGSNMSYLDTLGASQGRELAFNTSADAVFQRMQRMRNRDAQIQGALSLAGSAKFQKGVQKGYNQWIA